MLIYPYNRFIWYTWCFSVGPVDFSMWDHEKCCISEFSTDRCLAISCVENVKDRRIHFLWKWGALGESLLQNMQSNPGSISHSTVLLKLSYSETLDSGITELRDFTKKDFLITSISWDVFHWHFFRDTSILSNTSLMEALLVAIFFHPKWSLLCALLLLVFWTQFHTLL